MSNIGLFQSLGKLGWLKIFIGAYGMYEWIECKGKKYSLKIETLACCVLGWALGPRLSRSGQATHELGAARGPRASSPICGS
jgi:hypothetical protein